MLVVWSVPNGVGMARPPANSSAPGAVRQAILRSARAPVLLVHRGLRPGSLAPREGATRFTWSIEESPRYSQAVSFAPM